MGRHGLGVPTLSISSFIPFVSGPLYNNTAVSSHLIANYSIVNNADELNIFEDLYVTVMPGCPSFMNPVTSTGCVPMAKKYSYAIRLNSRE
jgi:hypothetical protein